ncbi:MAG: cytochrome C oxidase subunit IV family protein [Chloroflexi bacterium]|nr:cytochrome C oxidase subunit IV family protein [Chloroflexota bacterium]
MSMHEDHSVEEEHGLQPMQYVWIGVLLTIITIVELGASLWVDLGNALIPILIVLSAVKFYIVVAFYMHLRFEHRLLSQVFTGSFVLAAGVLIALIALFWTDITDII